MTGTTQSQTPPETDEDWARDTEKRLDNVEHPVASRAQDWVLATGEDGSLIACYQVTGGCVRLADVPPAGQDPDTIPSNALPYIRAIKQDAQTYPVGLNTVIFTSAQFDGAWGMDESGGSFMTVPRDGLYSCTWGLTRTDTTAGEAMVGPMVNSFVLQAVTSRGAGVANTCRGSDIFTLSAGDKLSMIVQTTGPTVTEGPIGSSVFTSMSLHMIRDTGPAGDPNREVN